MENFTTTTKRRASESKASEALALIRNTDQQGRVPPPLPYLPADYRPSPDSPRHFLVSSTHPASVLFDINSQTGSSNRRQRSHSIGYPLAIENTVNSSSSVTNNTSSSNIEHYELVPYHEWTIIARNQEKGQLVLYNQDNQSITVQNYLPNHFGDINTDRPLHFKSNEKFCPYCHQPILSPSGPERRLKTDEPDYMDRNYFRLLASSQANTASNSPTRSRSNTLSSESNKSESFNNQNLNANAFNQGYYSKFFVEINKLGKGFRGSVFLCEHVLDGVKLGKYAVKKVAIGNNHPWLVKMLREVHLLERLRHPNVVSYKHSWLEYCRLTPFGPEVPCLFILMECANGGNLEEYFERTKTDKKSENPMEPQRRKKSSSELKRERIRKQYQEQASFEQEQEISAPISHITRRLLTMSEIWSLFLDIVQGLAHLHQHNIVHRDLKPPNLLLKYDDHKRYNSYQGIPRVLISDFGECEDLDENYVNDDNRTGATGTLEFMAPEHVCLDLKGRNTVEYAPEADMWSLGMVLYFLCYSRLPYNVIDDVDLLRSEILSFKEVQFPGSRYDIYKDNSSLYTEAVNDPNIVSDIPNELKLLIRMLLSTDPSKRPSCNEILSKLRAFRIDKSTPLYEDIQHKWNNITTTAPSTSYARPSASSFTYHPTTTTTSRKPSLPSVLSTDTTSSSIIFDTEDSKETQDYYHSIKRPIKHRLSSSTHSTPPISEDKEMYREGMNTTLRKRQRLLGAEDKEGEETVMSDADDMRTKEGQKREEDMIHQDLLLVNNMLEASQRNRRLLDYQSTKVIKTITVLLKIISCTYSCSPYSTKPSLFYPVIFFAMLDFWSESNSPSLLLLVLHIVLIMGTTLISGGLCEAY
ncbi:kinase-like domain-containing protein [Cokeromyces recurvatus]|uniref:kinase-like domain-containing protein n=1 Tax=Cokeromyces recurvatus TaxID=90255 RepID=UPI00221EFDBA|nr:kinase-like domain-containing protein [Cokeromyces recurvatus]KAI7901785.1 kinase-like domain-containing protein [Cokeromyces recurvatus]